MIILVMVTLLLATDQCAIVVTDSIRGGWCCSVDLIQRVIWKQQELIDESRKCHWDQNVSKKALPCTAAAFGSEISFWFFKSLDC